MLHINDLVCTVNNTCILKKVNFSAETGKIHGLLGRNGSGKSTIMHCILDLLPVSEGSITYNDAAVHKSDIGFVPERSALFEELTGNEFLDIVMNFYNADSEHINRKNELISYFEIDEYIDRYIEDYPKGIKQRLSIVSALCHQNKLLILDEPFSGLDPFGALLLKKQLIKEKFAGKIILLSTHILEIAEIICDNVHIIENGECILSSSVDDVMKQFSESSDLHDIFLRLTAKEKYADLISMLKN